MKFSPEMRLVIACCRWPRSAERTEAIRAAAAKITDWGLLEAAAARHRVLPLVRDGLSCAGIELPTATEQRVRARAAERAMTALEMARESIRLQHALTAAGLPALVIKGSPLAVLAYGELGLKESWDIDLLTSPDAVVAAHSILQTLGYDLIEPSEFTAAQFDRYVSYGMEALYVHRDHAMAVELHWRVGSNKRLLPAVSARSRSQGVSVAGTELLTFADEILFAYLCVHGSLHFWSRLKWLADVGAFIAMRSPAEIERLYRGAVGMGAGRCPAVALLLCRRIFDVPLPPALLSKIGSDRATRLIEAQALCSIASPNGVSPSVASRIGWVFCRLLMAPGAAYLLAEARNIWDVPVERARFGGPPFDLSFHLLRLPRWFGRQLDLAVGGSSGIAGS